MFQDEGIDTTFLPFFSQNGEKWLMTTPYFQVGLNRDLEQDTARRNKAMKVLKSRLLEPLDITSLTCALLGDGTELGGGGMKMVTEDMAKFTYFLSRQGEWEGKQLLRKDWFERGGRMIVRFQEEKLLLEAEDTLISVGGLGISPRQALTAFEVKES